MEKNKLVAFLVGIVIGLLLLTAVGYIGGDDTTILGGTTNFDTVDVSDGYQVDGTTVIDGSGNVDAPVTTTDVTASDDLVVGDDVDITGNIVVDGNVLNTPSWITATTTLTTSSANEQLFGASASQITVTLPAVNATGTRFMFRVVGALTGVTVQITSAEKDNISGTLIVAGAVVDCRAEDYINIITDGEVAGDYVEFISSGYQGWLIGDSGVLASGKMTCTDPS